MAERRTTGIFCLFFLGCTLVAQAKPVTLKCSTELGPYTAPFVIDLKAHSIKWQGNYTIYFESPAVIAAYADMNKYTFGNGEVLVLDRKTGAFKETGIVIFYLSNPIKITTYTHHGHCDVSQLPNNTVGKRHKPSN